jgi:hypothetical protein
MGVDVDVDVDVDADKPSSIAERGVVARDGESEDWKRLENLWNFPSRS